MDDYQVCRTSIAVDLPFPPNLIFVVLPSYSAISSFYPIFCLSSLFAGVHVQVYLFSGAFLFVYSALKARFYLMNVMRLSPCVESVFLK